MKTFRIKTEETIVTDKIYYVDAETKNEAISTIIGGLGTHENLGQYLEESRPRMAEEIIIETVETDKDGNLL